MNKGIVVILIAVFVSLCVAKFGTGKLFPIPGSESWQLGGITVNKASKNLTVYADKISNGSTYWVFTTTFTAEDGSITIADSKTMKRRGDFGVLYAVKNELPMPLVLATDIPDGVGTTITYFVVSANGALSDFQNQDIPSINVFPTHYVQESASNRSFLHNLPALSSLDFITVSYSIFSGLTFPSLYKFLPTKLTLQDAVVFPEKDFAIISYAADRYSGKTVKYYNKYMLGYLNYPPQRIAKDDTNSWLFAPRDDGSLVGVIYAFENNDAQTILKVVDYQDMRTIGKEMVVDGKCIDYTYDLYYNRNIFVICGIDLYQLVVDDVLGFTSYSKLTLPAYPSGLSSNGNYLIIRLTANPIQAIYVVPYTLMN